MTLLSIGFLATTGKVRSIKSVFGQEVKGRGALHPKGRLESILPSGCLKGSYNGTPKFISHSNSADECDGMGGPCRDKAVLPTTLLTNSIQSKTHQDRGENAG